MALPDYAIVVGIKSYPVLGPGDTPADLVGSERGATQVADWLKTKGGLAPGNVQLIPSNPPPTTFEIEAAMRNLDDIAQRQLAADKGDLIGRRLYIYMSGHGFSPGVQQGCLYTANARARQTYNIHATAWLKWFQDAGYFREFVLWMDCCMDRVSTLAPNNPNLALTLSDRPPGPSFVAFAAQRPLKAAEVTNPQTGQMEGAFTWALLEGLEGAAADPNGRVTGRSLADWLRQSVRARLPDAAKSDFDISKEPEIVSESADLIFARELVPRTYQVRFTAKEMPKKRELVVWTGSPLRDEYRAVVAGADVTLGLPPGLYHAEISGAGLGASFEVVCDRVVSLAAGTPALRKTDRLKLYRFNYNPPDPTVEITVVDRAFAAVERGLGHLVTSLPAGVFKLRTRLGRTLTDTVILLDGDMDTLGADLPALVRSSVVPIMGNLASHEYQAEAVSELGRRGEAAKRKTGKKTSSISLMVRAFSDGGAGVDSVEPWQGISIVDQHEKPVIGAKEYDLHLIPGGDPFALAAVGIPPGDYTLLHKLPDGATLAQSLIVPKGWALEVHILRRVLRDPGQGVAFDPRSRISVHMLRDGIPIIEDERKVIEAARTALTDERPILSEELKDLLLRKYHNPIAGILGAHLLILGEEAGQIFEPGLLNEVVGNLRGLVGTDHPDVEAVSLRCTANNLRTKSRRISRVPMFERSWRLLVQASYNEPRLLSEKLVNRLLTPTAFPPFLAWPHDPETRQDSMDVLREAIWAPELVGSGSVASAIMPPVGAAAGLEALAPQAPGMAARQRSLSPAVRADRKLAKTRAQSLNLPASAFSKLA